MKQAQNAAKKSIPSTKPVLSKKRQVQINETPIAPKRAKTPTLNEQKTNKFVCTECNALYPSRNALFAHMVENHPDSRIAKTFTCQICGKVFKKTKDKIDHEIKCYSLSKLP